MNGQRCEQVRDLLPDWILGSVDPAQERLVSEHLSSCRECGKEEGVLRALLAHRPEPPLGLEERLRARVREAVGSPASEAENNRDAAIVPFRRRPRWASTWVLSAAAVLVLSLAIGLLWNGENGPGMEDTLQVASEEPLPEAWLWDDGMVAGAPVLDGLTDEQLEALIEELEG